MVGGDLAGGADPHEIARQTDVDEVELRGAREALAGVRQMGLHEEHAVARLQNR